VTGNGSRPLLEARDLTAGFGSHQVLHGVSIRVAPGEIAGVFGLNGAGKSVMMKVLAGMVPAWSGTVTFDGRDVTMLSPEKRVAAGIGNVPQGRQVFPALTVDENLRIGAYTSRRRDKHSYGTRLARIYEQFPILGQRRGQLAGSLSGGEQAALAVGRALINAPKLILVDEPSAGLAPKIVHELGDILRQVVEAGVAMILVEQNVTFGLTLVDRAHILQTGRIVHEGPVGELDHGTLATQLGIGRMLTRTTATALAGRQDDAEVVAETPDGELRVKRTPTKKKPAARKRSAAKKTVSRKTTATRATARKTTTAKKTTARARATKASRNGAPPRSTRKKT